MTRRLLPLFGLLACLGAASPAFADAVLRPTVIVQQDTIKLGDLFDNVGDKADQVVARSPLPGRRAVVDSNWLRKIAYGNGVRWVPDNPFVQAVIERAGTTVGAGEIQQAVIGALIAQGVPKDSDVELASGSSGVVVPVGADLSVGIEGLYYDSNSNRFTATAIIPADSPTAQRVPVSGRVYATVMVPVLNHPAERGVVLSAKDFNFAKQRRDTLRGDAMSDVDQIIGLTPKHTLQAGAAVSMNDLQKPIAVTRGSMVSVVLKTPVMLLTTQGRAMDDGAIGDVIRVINTRSNMTVQGTVNAAGEVTVLPGGSLAMN